MVGSDDLIEVAMEHAKQKRWISRDDIVVVLHGLTENTPGLTNVVKIIQANDHGYTSPHAAVVGLPFP